MKPSNSQRQRVQAAQKQRQTTDPQLVVNARLLAVPAPELDQILDQELLDNPALERIDLDEADQCDGELFGELAGRRSEREHERDDACGLKSGHVAWSDVLAAMPSLHQYLEAQIERTLTGGEARLARHVIDCVNDDGYLDLPPEEIALLANASLEETEEAIRAVQGCDPPGVAAETLQECLLLQLERISGPAARNAARIVSHGWDLIDLPLSPQIQKRLKISKHSAEAAFRLIASLSPYPGQDFLDAFSHSREQRISKVTPEIIFERSPAGVHVHVAGLDPNLLIVSRWHIAKYKQLKKSTDEDDVEQREYLNAFIQRAREFITAVTERRRTLYDIAEALLERQRAFITTGEYRMLQTMTQKALASAAGVHESTVSRAVAGKTIQLASGDVIPFETFFKQSIRIKLMIEQILSYENPKSPLTDDAITEQLHERGVKIARRTVSKYREELRRLGSRRRKRKGSSAA